MTAAAQRWAEQLAAWAIPEEILAAAPESPWALPPSQFRVERRDPGPGSPSHTAALGALPEGGSVLDVGAGAGAASLPLVPPAALVVAVDTSDAMLDAFATAAEERNVGHREVLGAWPDVAASMEPADVAVCHHVLYNVPDLPPFLAALGDRARRRVVVELTATHPLTPLNRLWRHFHGIERPTGPTADDLLAVLGELGVTPEVARWSRPGPAPADHHGRAELVAMTRRRLCLTADRDDEIDGLLGTGEDQVAAPREVATVWWTGGG